MSTERENMLAGADYDSRDPELTAGRRRARALLFDFNHSGPDEDERRARLLAELLGGAGRGLWIERLWIEPPFRCDYGAHIHLGAQVYFNFGCVILDPAEVRVGDRVLFGPGVQIYTATHPLDMARRRAGVESARGIAIGSDVWVGGGAILLPGVAVGAGAVIGAGSMLTRDVPAGVLAAGNPCRVIRALD